MLTLPAEAYAAVLDHCSRALPDEACGIIAGPAGQPHADVSATRVVPLANVADRPGSRFEFDPTQQLAAYDQMDALREDPVVLYHSHPAGPPVPSPTDVAAAAGGTCLWLIVAMAGPAPKARVWAIDGDQVTEHVLQIVDGPSGPPA